MRHLRPDELIDLAEGTRPESSASHLRTCEACRRQLADARAMIAAAADVDVPEPSPLFWEHFSVRVREAIGTQPMEVAEGAPSADTAIAADDLSLDLVADLAADVDWDAAAESNATMQEGVADNAVTQLTEAERRELRRLLQQELARSGA